MKSKSLLLAFFLCTLYITQAQVDWRSQMSQRSANFNAIKAAFLQEYPENSALTLTAGQQSEIDFFNRWAYRWESRADAQGNFPSQEELQRTVDELSTGNLVTNSYVQGTGNWESIGPNSLPANGTGQLNGIGRMTSIAFHPTDADIMFAGAPTGGFWKTTDGGDNWSEFSNGLIRLGVSSIVVNSTDPNIIYIGTGDRDGGDTPGYGVWKTTDGGLNWSASNLGMGNITINEVIMDPTNSNVLIAAGSNFRVYKTINAGANWTTSNNLGDNPKDIDFHPTNSNIVYASGTEFNISADGGATFARVTSVLPNSPQRMSIATSIDEPNWVYVLAGDSSGLIGIYRSTDSGNNFTLQADSPNVFDYVLSGSGTGFQASYNNVINADPTDANIIYTGGINIWKSTDAGVTMNSVSYWVGPLSGRDGLKGEQFAIEFSPFDNSIYVANTGGIAKSANTGTTWEEINNGLNVAQVYKIGVSQNIQDNFIIGQQDNGTVIYDGSSYITEIGGSGMECIIDPTDESYMYGSLPYGDIRRSTNGGNTFSSISGVTGENGAYITPYKLDPNNANTMFAGYNDVWRNDAVRTGTSWTQISNFANTANIRDLEVAPSNSNIIYVSKEDNSFRRSGNALSASPTWTDLSANLPVNNEPLDIEIDPTDPDHLFIALDNNIYESIDGGGSWSDISGALPDINLNTIVIDKNSAVDAMYVGMDVGVYYRDNTLSDWTSYSTGLSNVEITELEIQYLASSCKGKLFAATYGQGTWSSDLKDPGNRAPLVCFESSATDLCFGSIVTLQDLSDFTPTSWSWTITPNTFSYINSTTSTSQNPEIQFIAAGTYSVALTATNANGSTTETKTSYINVSTSSTANLFNEDFESQVLCGTASNCATTVCNITGLWNNLTNGDGDDIDWRTDQGGTPSAGTGPSTDFSPGTATGNYLYIEASSCSSTTAILESNCIELDQNYTFNFAYHMFGTAIGSLHVDLNNGVEWIEDIIPAVSGDQGNEWKTATLDLASYTGSTIRLRIRGIIGDGFASDIAIDALSFESSNDDLVNAHEVFYDTPSVSKPYNFTNATVEAGETFTTFNGNTISSNTTGSLWFKFVATTTEVLIRTDSDDVMNLAIQLIDAANDTPVFTELSNYRGRYGNDLNGTAYEPWISEESLNIGETYFVQVHNIDGTDTNFNLLIEEARSYIYAGGAWVTALGNPDGINDPYASVAITSGNVAFTAASTLVGDLGTATNATLTTIDNSTLTVNGRLFTGSVATSIDAGAGSTLSFIDHGNDFLFGNGVTTGKSNLHDIQVVNRLENSIGSSLNISGSFKLKNNINVSGTTVTFKNDADNLGIIAHNPQFLGNLIGDVTVENFVPERNGTLKRAFRFLGSPVISTSTIFEQWQENGNSPSGFGTHITGIAGAVGSVDSATGLDQTNSGNNSLYSYDATAAAWTELISTNQAGNVLNTGEGYRLFVRGDRNIDLSSNASSSNTTLRSTGTLSMADKSVNYDVEGGQFVLIANPYQNALSVEALIDDSSNITDDIVYYWDPNLGGAAGLGAYVTYTGFDNGGTGSGIPASNNNGTIQPGQAVFLFANAGANGVGNDMVVNYSTSQLNESGVLRGAGNRVNGITNGNGDRITMNLYDTFSYNNGYSVTDAMMVRFSDSNSNAIGTGDFVKIYNAHESIAINQEAGDYAIASREMPLTSELLQLKHYNYGDADYTYVIDVDGLLGSNVFLHDNFLSTSTPLVTGNNVIAFSVDSAIAGSMDIDRFQLRFEDVTLGIAGVNLEVDFVMYPNPSNANEVVTLKSSSFSGKETMLRITDLSGKLINSKTIQFNNQGTFEIKTNYLKPGIYLVELTDKNNQKTTRKLVVE
jgi:photosystem II stability/assembly factor-like uncharacterized protein